ncbi:ATP-binding protein [Niallia circulans]|uniref:ATP-binding protein n=1 Tax=Niallia circulans TaxID=1397 RepID=UPI0026F1E682|nr:ATP-binding protein [Niallia circulans]
MPTLGIFGPQGSGKSFFAMLLARSLQLQDKNLMIYTNMNVTGDNIQIINDLGVVPFADNKNKVLIIDEAYFTLDSRNSSSKNNRIWSKAYALFRKSDFVLTIFITHRPRMIDVNLREQMQYYLMCRKNSKHFDYLLLDAMSLLQVPILIPKDNYLFNFANYDTKDFPLPITITSLETHPLFQIAK